MIPSKIIKAIKLLESKIADLNAEIKNFKESVAFLSGKHDELTNDYIDVVRENHKRKKDNKFLNKRANGMQKKNEEG